MKSGRHFWNYKGGLYPPVNDRQCTVIRNSDGKADGVFRTRIGDFGLTRWVGHTSKVPKGNLSLKIRGFPRLAGELPVITIPRLKS
jgi:hypothetical protein